MPTLDHLFAELCPDGIPHKTLGEIATDMYRGAGIKREEVTVDGFPCVRYGEIYTTYGIWFDSCASYTQSGTKTFEHGDILFAITGESVEEIAKSCAYIGHEKCYAGGDIVVMKHTQDPKYISYALSTVDAQTQKSKGKVKSKVVHSSIPALQAITIPLPPLAIQREIVRILDNFTELTAELTARKKQYEYYRNELLTFGDDVPMVALGDMAAITRGSGLQKSDFTQTGVPCIHYGQIYTYYGTFTKSTKSFVSKETAANLKRVGTGDIIIAVTSENIEDVCKCVAWLGDDEIVTGGHTAIVKHEQNPKYIAYWLQTAAFFEQKRKIAHGTKVIEVTPSKLTNVKIPLPPLAEQARIVSILDKFDTLTTDITAGLPAEIAARQKQYEYYRDKLLTFKEAGA